MVGVKPVMPPTIFTGIGTTITFRPILIVVAKTRFGTSTLVTVQKKKLKATHIYRAKWTEGVAEIDSVNRGRTTSRNGRAS